ncbi:MAG: hypothetical protein JWP34_5304 [Massilia sp.]|nr:hypothetical protein [Massilia sp.]
MKTAIKRTTMWLHNHGALSQRATDWMFRTFGLGGA